MVTATWKRPQMGRVASELSDLAIVTSDNPRSEDPQAIIEEIWRDRRLGGGRARPARGNRDGSRSSPGGRRRRDCGKGAEQGQEFADRKIPFDDREVAREELRRLRAPA